MNQNIIKISEELARSIARCILLKEKDYPYLFGEKKVREKGFFSDLKRGYFRGREENKIEREIYTRSLHEANAFFIKNTEAKFDENINDDMELVLNQRLQNPNCIRKMEQEEKLAHVIKINVIEMLMEQCDNLIL